jgi:transcriptional regulator with XRE-family HTH domain
MSGRSELSKRIKNLRGDLSQGKFAKAVGVPRPNISEYEAGTKLPGFKPLTRLGIHAERLGRHTDALWFFGQSGRETKELIELGVELARVKPGNLTATVPPHPLVPIEGKPADFAHSLSLPNWMVLRRENMAYVRATDDFIAPFRRGDLVFVDTSETSPSNLMESFVVAYRPDDLSNKERRKFERELAEGLSPEEVRRRRGRRQFPFLRTGVFIGRLIRGKNISESPAIEVRTASGDTLLEHLPDLAPGTREERAIYAQYARLQILGRAVGWFSPALRKLPHPYKEELKK